MRFRIQIRIGRGRELLGVNAEFAILPASDGDPAIKLDGRGHREAVVVIGVLSDQINASRGAIDVRVRAKARTKPLKDGRTSGHHLLSNPKTSEPGTWSLQFFLLPKYHGAASPEWASQSWEGT